MEVSIKLEAWIEFLDLCRESLLHSNQLFFLSLSFSLSFPSLFPSRRSVSGSSIALSKWDCIRLAERSATVTVNNYSGQWRKPWQLPIIAISPWQTPTYCRRTIYDDAEMRVVTFAVIIPPCRNSGKFFYNFSLNTSSDRYIIFLIFPSVEEIHQWYLAIELLMNLINCKFMCNLK